MLKKTIIIFMMLSLIAVQLSGAMTLAEAMMRLRIEALKAQMDEFLLREEFDKARLILGEMAKLDEKIQSSDKDRANVYASIPAQASKPQKQPRDASKPQTITTPENAQGRYEKTIVQVCTEMDFDPAVIWTILAIESNFSEDPVVVQRKSKCLGPWQHQPEHYIHYRKADGTPYNPFDIRDACEVTVRILKDNLAVTGDLEKSIRMYASGSRHLDTPYERLPASLRGYLDKFSRIYPDAKKRFAKYGIYDAQK